MAIERIDLELCNGCGICVKICPMDVFRMDKQGKKSVITYPEDCMLCEFCVLDCPTKAITVTPEKTSPLLLSWG
jgi:NAD-dependent dihydropyrimidine dehydrogenase PreA subunit